MMVRVLLFEQWHSGHHLQFLSALIEPLLSIGCRVVVAVGPRGRGSREFAQFVGPFASRIEVDGTVPDAKPWMPLRDRPGLTRRLRETVARHRPDYVLAPSADGQTTAQGLWRLAGRGAVPGGVPAEGGIHVGLGSAARTRAQRGKTLVYEASCGLSAWDAMHFFNPVMRDAVARRCPWARARLRVSPCVVQSRRSGDRAGSRRALGLPEDGRYVGFAGKLDERKAIDALARAFRDVARPGDRLLLAGELAPRWRELIAGECGGLVRDGRVLMLDRFLSKEEFGLAFSALDLVCVPYPEHGEASATLLEAAMADRPVLASDWGFTGMVTRRFGLGWACGMRDPAAFARTMREALDGAAAFRRSPAADRLAEFHTAENFARCWMVGVRRRMGLGDDPALRTWEWACEGTDA